MANPGHIPGARVREVIGNGIPTLLLEVGFTKILVLQMREAEAQLRGLKATDPVFGPRDSVLSWDS